MNDYYDNSTLQNIDFILRFVIICIVVFVNVNVVILSIFGNFVFLVAYF